MPTIAHFVTTLHTGGTERQLVELLRSMDADRFRPRMICIRPEGTFLRDLEKLGVHPYKLEVRRTLARPATLGVIVRLAAWLRSEEVSLLHCHDVYTVLVGVPAARLAGIPVIAARRDLAHHLTPAKRLALRFAMARATAVLTNAVTVAAQAEAEDGVPASRLAIVPNGIDLAAFDRAMKILHAPIPAHEGPTVLTVARMTHPAKGHDDLLEAAVHVQAAIPGVRFLIAGDGPREGELRAQAEARGLSGAVRFLGRRHDVPALLAHVDLVCHLALAEGMPNAIMEAMAAARPVVATSVGGVPELVRHGVTGLLVPPRDARGAARAIIALLGDRAGAEKLGQAARARVEAEYTTARLAARTSALYETILSHDARYPLPRWREMSPRSSAT
jgi:glycosyltransferase involved in cell wall biosynthesis